MSSRPLSHWTFSYAETGSFVQQKVSPFSKHTDSTLPITASTFCLIFLFLYAEPNFSFTNEEIDDTQPTDCQESSQELEEDVSTWSTGISNFCRLCLRGVEQFGRLPGKLLCKDNFSPFDSWGISPSSLLKSLSDTQHKSWVGLWSISDSFKICSLMVRFSDKKASDRRNSDSDGFLRT